ncbi:MAG: ribosome small subunit-dependent GTPase A [Bacteroidales bacterium]|nr:ribosome small subunit-dependent GTPase A [Bacteroidales bacterium]
MSEGLVIRTTGSWYKVLPTTSMAHAVDCRLRGSYRLRGNKQTNPIAVGDTVVYTMQDDGTGVITDVHDRKNYIVRRATKLSKQSHVLAANIDLLCIVATVASPRTSTGFIDRLLATAEAYHISACLIFNKIDIIDNALQTQLDELVHIYRTVGYEVHLVSAQRGDGIEELRTALKGKTVLMGGHSGVGKSALLNALCPGLNLRVGDISDWSLKGRHTTTFAEIFPLHLGDATADEPLTYLIDSPGIKEFGVVDIAPSELGHFFPDIRRLLPQCHFANCTHRHEPNCAVRQAVENGDISASRYRSYLNIIDDIEQT